MRPELEPRSLLSVARKCDVIARCRPNRNRILGPLRVAPVYFLSGAEQISIPEAIIVLRINDGVPALEVERRRRDVWRVDHVRRSAQRLLGVGPVERDGVDAVKRRDVVNWTARDPELKRGERR